MFKELYETPELKVIEVYGNLITASCDEDYCDDAPCNADSPGEPIIVNGL